MSSTKTSTQIAEEETLRRGVAQAMTWEDFGKFLKKFRGKKISLRALECHLHLSYTAIWEREEGKNQFKKNELRAYLAACGADEELITFCLHHYRRTTKSLPQQATSAVSNRNKISDQSERGCESLSPNDASSGGFVVPSQSTRKNWAKGLLSFIGLFTVLMLLMSITPKLYFTIKWWIAGWTTTVSGYGAFSSSCLMAADYDRAADRAAVYMRVCGKGPQVWRLVSLPHAEPEKSYYHDPLIRNLVTVDRGKCLDVTMTGVVVARTCNNSVTQDWYILIPTRSVRDVKESVLASFCNIGVQACLAVNNKEGFPLTVAAPPDESHQMSLDYDSKKFRITDPDWPAWPSWVPR